MAERATRKTKRPASTPARRRSSAVSTPVEKTRSSQKLEAAERERDLLKEKLAEALARIAELEKARDEAVNRIDWAIDSLHNVLEREA